MCGIVGYAGRRNALPILLDGLKRLEYRGYDSAGVAIVGSALQVVKDKGFIANLEAQLPPLKGTTGFAHTRWATHGPPSKVNAHPHVDCHGKIALAHNGIIENFASLREKLEAGGHTFVSQTDTESVLYVMDKEMVVITPKGVELKDLEGRAVKREPQRITWSLEDAEKGGFEHFMLKEIHEGPKAIQETLLGRLANLEVNGFLSEGVTSVKLVACGTSYHAALVGKYILEEIARIPASAELASEYRYSQGPSERPLVILISQSGETADTLGAAPEARRRGCKTLGITNVLGSSLTRETDLTLYTRAGIEISVAGTKTFYAQLVVLYLIALKIGQDRGALGYDELDSLKDHLRSLPRTVQYVLNKADEIRALAAKYGNARDVFFIGRHVNYPIALEGALKLKEISYIHGEAYAAGELKHGPLARLARPRDRHGRGQGAASLRRRRHLDPGRAMDLLPRRRERGAATFRVRSSPIARLPDRQAEEPREERHGRVIRARTSSGAWGCIRIHLFSKVPARVESDRNDAQRRAAVWMNSITFIPLIRRICPISSFSRVVDPSATKICRQSAASTWV